MLRFPQVLWILALVALLLGPARAQGPPGPPGTPQVAPAWAPVPGVPGVEYAPNLQVDFFRHRGFCYSYHQGLWYQGKGTAGPWKQIKKVPAPLYQIDAAYFRTPPGWAKGKKTGWKGAPMPPGQMKKGGAAP